MQRLNEKGRSVQVTTRRVWRMIGRKKRPQNLQAIGRLCGRRLAVDVLLRTATVVSFLFAACSLFKLGSQKRYDVVMTDLFRPGDERSVRFNCCRLKG
jgi:hypothetical protein